MSKGYRLAEIAKWVGGAVRGDAGTLITGVAGVGEADSSQITWIANEKYLSQLQVSRAGAVVVSEQFGETPMPAVLVSDPAVAFSTILDRFAPPIPRPAVGVHPTACVAETAELGRDVAVGPNVVIGENAKVGDGAVLHAGVFIGDETAIGQACELWPGVVVRERCTLGNQVVIHPNTVIGADGFGYQFVDGRHAKIPQIGTVEIGDEVEIGANCCVDRAKFGTTRIGAGTKIDNLVQVAHNVQIGPTCVVVAQSGMGGSARLGRGVVIGGQTAIRDNVALGDGVQVGARSGVSKDISPGARVLGVPAVDIQQCQRERAKIRRLPEMAEQLKDLIKRVDRLETSADDSEDG